MRKDYFFLIFSLFPFITFGEGIKFFDGSWNQVLVEAKKQNKAIFIDIYAVWCGPCKVMSNNIFTQNRVGEKFNSAFINYKIDGEKGEGIELARRYAITAYPTYLFVHSSGDLVYRAMGSMPVEKFLSEADKAISSNKNFKPFAELEKEYKNGNREKDFLFDYIKRRRSLGEDNSKILDEYLKILPESEQKTEKVLKLVAENIESIESKAFEVLVNANKRLLSMTKEQQNAIIYGIGDAKRLTFKKILQTRNKVLLEKLIEAVKNTSMTKSTAEIEENQFRLDYAKATKDAESFKQIAQKETSILMKKTISELEKESFEKIEIEKKRAKMSGIDTSSQQFQVRIMALQNSAVKTTSFKLNDYAWGYYEMINTLSDLEEALLWSKKAIQLVESPANYETHSHLLYKLGKKKEATESQKEAIKIAKKMGGNTDVLEETLKKMKKGKL